MRLGTCEFLMAALIALTLTGQSTTEAELDATGKKLDETLAHREAVIARLSNDYFLAGRMYELAFKPTLALSRYGYACVYGSVAGCRDFERWLWRSWLDTERQRRERGRQLGRGR